eukprot:jgi/Picsp_1/3423/NSC_06261-R1_---NA---
MAEEYVCETESAWRSSPLYQDPVQFSDYDVTDVDYYTGQVIPSVWPSAIGAAVLAVLLIFWILWRLLNACGCVCCCVAKKKKNLPLSRNPAAKMGVVIGPEMSYSRPQGLKFIRTWWVVMGVMFLGSLGSCIFGMVRVDPALVDTGSTVLDDATQYIGSILGTVQSSVDAAKALDSSLENIQLLSTSEVAALGIQSDLNCIKPWLSQLPNSAQLVSSVDQVFPPAQGLASAAQDASKRIRDVISSDGSNQGESSVIESIIGAPAKLGKLMEGTKLFAQSAQQLPTVEDRIALLQAQEYLIQVFGDSGSEQGMEEYISKLSSSISIVPDVVQSLAETLPELRQQALEFLRDEQVQALIDVYEKQKKAYEDSKGCIQSALTEAKSLLQRNDVPAEYSDYINLLSDAEVQLKDLFEQSGTFSMNSVMYSIDEIIRESESMVNDIVELDTQGSLEGAQALVQPLIESQDAIASLDTQVKSLLTQMDLYEKEPPGVARADLYDQIFPQIKLLGTVAATAADAIDSWLVDASGLINDATKIYKDAQNLGIQEYLDEIDQISDSIDSSSLPDVVASYDSIFQQLPSPPDSLVDSIDNYLQGALSVASNMIASIRADVQEIVSSVEPGISNAREETINRIQEYRGEYEPIVRKYDTYRLAIMYLLFGLIIFFGLMTLSSSIAIWPAALSLSVTLMLLLMMIIFALIVAYTAGLKVGSDTCYHLEPFILEEIGDEGAKEVLTYYFDGGQGTSIEVIVETTFDINIQEIEDKIAQAKTNILSEIEGITLTPDLETEINKAIGHADRIIEGINGAMALLDYEQAFPQYLQARHVCHSEKIRQAAVKPLV